MATINAQAKELIIGNAIYTWALAAGDDGAPVGLTGSGDRTVQIEGTFGTATVLVEGSLDMANWRTLRDASGTALSFTSANIKTVMENVVAIRPRVSGGDGSTAITATIAIRRDRNG